MFMLHFLPLLKWCCTWSSSCYNQASNFPLIYNFVKILIVILILKWEVKVKILLFHHLQLMLSEASCKRHSILLGFGVL